MMIPSTKILKLVIIAKNSATMTAETNCTVY